MLYALVFSSNVAQSKVFNIKDCFFQNLAFKLKRVALNFQKMKKRRGGCQKQAQIGLFRKNLI